MARPREFDEEQVLDAIVSAFWSRGFEATSIEDLLEATGLSRASLYGAFGDKEKIFERAIAHYVERQAGMNRDAQAEASPLRAIQMLLEGWVSGVCGRDQPRGCFLLVAGTEKDTDSRARELVRDQHKKLEGLLTELIERGQKMGEIAKTHDARAMAKLLVVLQQGLATSARTGWSRDRLSAVTKQAVEVLRG